MAGKPKKMFTEDRERVAMLSAAGKSNRAIAREMSVTPQAVDALVKKPDMQALIAEKQAKIATMCEDTAIRALNFITDEKLEKSSASQLAVITGIQVEKALLLRGGNPGGVNIQIVIADPTGGSRAVAITGSDQTARYFDVTE